MTTITASWAILVDYQLTTTMITITTMILIKIPAIPTTIVITATFSKN